MKTFKRRPERVADSQPDRSDAAEVADQGLADRAEDVLDEIDCCLAEVESDDEEAAAKAFSNLYRRLHHGEIGDQELRDQGDLLKARFAHTEYVQGGRCCSCGCPWNE